jgi:GDPmannose 4,6-dehydratase
MVVRKALITGITGQDGSYLAELLLAKGYEVHGLIRRASTFNTQRINHLYIDPHDPKAKLFLHYADLTDGSRLSNLISKIKPQEIYNLAAQSHVRVSFDEPEYTGDTIALGTIRLLEAIRHSAPEGRFYQASSSEMFGAANPPQNETTAFYPRSPYGVAKVYSFWMTKNYREAYGLHLTNGILFNHESPRRGETFVTRKITRGLANIAQGVEQCLFMGNMDALRDWGHAKDYVRMQWMMLQQEQPEDYVIATGIQYSVRDFVTIAAQDLGLDIKWIGQGINEQGVVQESGGTLKTIVKVDSRYFRPTEVETLLGDATKAREKLGWQPKIGFEELVREMIQADLQLAKKDQLSRQHGFVTMDYRE